MSLNRNQELEWFNTGEAAFLNAVATLASGMLQQKDEVYLEDTQRAVQIASKVLTQFVTGELNEI